MKANLHVRHARHHIINKRTNSLQLTMNFKSNLICNGFWKYKHLFVPTSPFATYTHYLYIIFCFLTWHMYGLMMSLSVITVLTHCDLSVPWQLPLGDSHYPWQLSQLQLSDKKSIRHLNSKNTIKLWKNPYRILGLHVHVHCTLPTLPYLPWPFQCHHNVLRMSQMHDCTLHMPF